MTSLGKWLGGLLGDGSDDAPAPAPAPSNRPITAPRPRTPAGDNNSFAVDVYGKLRGAKGNIFFSPFSLRTAFAMAFAGARGRTEEEIRQVLRFPPAGVDLHTDFAGVIARLNAAGGGAYEMAVANSLWGQSGYFFVAEFLALVARYYAGGMNEVDFIGDAETARRAINAWVEQKTKGRIPDLIPPDGVTSDTRLTLVNAVYFKGLWILPFQKEDTTDAPFFLADGGKAAAPLMSQQSAVSYMQGDGFQAVDLAYRGEDLSMLVLLPKERNGLGHMEAALSGPWLDDCASKLLPQEVRIFLPRFKLTWGTAELSRELSGLGMPLAFDGTRADFSGMNGRRPPDTEALHIGAVFHKAFVDVNEEGTEAAAATAIAMMAGSCPGEVPPIPVFRADHPFLFAIRDRKTGVILFLGGIMDPSREM